MRNNSANFKQAELIKIGKGYFSKSLGNLIIASHCSPTLADLKPKKETIYKQSK